MSIGSRSRRRELTDQRGEPFGWLHFLVSSHSYSLSAISDRPIVVDCVSNMTLSGLWLLSSSSELEPPQSNLLDSYRYISISI